MTRTHTGWEKWLATRDSGDAEGWVVCADLPLYELESLFDWLQNTGQPLPELRLTSAGVALRWPGSHATPEAA